jgi:hypothetical protein
MKKSTISFPLSFILLAGILLVIIGLNGCTFDNEEDLYPQPPACDTLDVTYSGTIVPIMNDNCNDCHGGAAPLAGVRTDTYDGLKVIADNNHLWGVVNHEPGFSPMPKNLPKLNDCDLAKISLWLDNGALNN